jgi:hypothetical protein
MICFIYLIIESVQYKMSNRDRIERFASLVMAHEELDRKHIKCQNIFSQFMHFQIWRRCTLTVPPYAHVPIYIIMIVSMLYWCSSSE